MATYFLHDVPQDVLRTGPEQPREEADTVFSEPCRFERWPDILIHVLAGEETIAFSRLNFNGVSRVKGSEWRWRKFPAVISSRCRMRKD